MRVVLAGSDHEAADMEFCKMHAAAPTLAAENKRLRAALEDALQAIRSLPDDALGMETVQVTEQGKEVYPLKFELEANIMSALFYGDDNG